MLATGIERVLSEHAKAMENSLLGLADSAPLAETRDIYFQALGVLGRQGPLLFSSCKQILGDTVSEAWEGKRTTEPTLSELSLVDDTGYEASLAVNKSSARLRYNCAEELVGLDARIGVLLDKPSLASDDNPFGTKTLCESLLKGMDKLKIEQKLQLVLLNQFDLVLNPDLPAIYQEMNRHLLENGILKDFKAGIHARLGQNSRAKPAFQPQVAAQAQAEQGDLLGLFEKLAVGGGGMGGGMGLPGVSGGAGGMPGGMGGGGAGGGESGAALLGFSMLEALNRLQVGALSLPGGGSIDLRGSMGGTGYSNVVRELQQSPAMKSASQVETVMIDAVAMLFDYLFDDRAIPEHLKEIIAQLQVPVLKAAITDRQFFTDREHPVRQVLDMIASLAVQPTDEEGRDDPLLDEVKAVIQKIIDEYGEDSGVFMQAYTTLAELKARREQELEKGSEVVNMMRAERAEVAEAFVRKQIMQALSEQPGPESLVMFLRDHWSKLLKREFISEGESSPHLSAQLETMRELLWSVQNKADMDGRLMLVRILPGLLKRLREGAEKAQMPRDESEKFFSALVSMHADAVRTNTLTVPLPDAEPLLVELPQVEAEQQILEAAPADPPLPDIQDEYAQLAATLKKGDRLEMHNDDGSMRLVNVIWVSGLKGNYLLADANGQNMFSISPQRLADKLRGNQASILGQGSVTESAFSKLVSFFKQRVSAA